MLSHNQGQLERITGKEQTWHKAVTLPASEPAREETETFLDVLQGKELFRISADTMTGVLHSSPLASAQQLHTPRPRIIPF